MTTPGASRADDRGGNARLTFACAIVGALWMAVAWALS
jgi:hypothetical protein